MFQYIVIEGPIGVGKTSLTKLLAKELNARLILEKPEENPFLPPVLPRSEEICLPDPDLLPAEPFFSNRRKIAQLDLFNQVTLSDYLFAKDRIFASLNLDDHELALYEQIYSLLNGQIPTPDLVIYLQAKPEVLLQRIKSRNIAYEREVDLDYLKTLTEAS